MIAIPTNDAIDDNYCYSYGKENFSMNHASRKQLQKCMVLHHSAVFKQVNKNTPLLITPHTNNVHMHLRQQNNLSWWKTER